MTGRHAVSQIPLRHLVAFVPGGARELPAGSVLVVTRGPDLAHRLPVDVAKRPRAASRDVRALICGPRLRPDFLRACLANQAVSLLGRTTVTSHGVRVLPDEALRNLLVPCPPLSVQDEIVSGLRQRSEDIGALISAKRSALPYLIEQRRSTIFAAATCGIARQSALRPTGLPWAAEIPAHWEIRKLSHLGRIRMGATPPRHRAEYWVDGTVPWLTSTVVNEWEVTSAREFVAADAVREYHLPELRAGTVLVATAGEGRTRGQATILAMTATINQNIIAIEPDKALVDPWYLRWILGAAYDYLRAISNHSGSITGALKMSDISNFRIPVPPVAEQSMIAGHISRNVEILDRITSATQRAIDLLEELDCALLATATVTQ